MHNATTKQRIAALRRKLGIFTGAPAWVRQRRARVARTAAAELEPCASSTPPDALDASVPGTDGYDWPPPGLGTWIPADPTAPALEVPPAIVALPPRGRAEEPPWERRAAIAAVSAVALVALALVILLVARGASRPAGATVAAAAVATSPGTALAAAPPPVAPDARQLAAPARPDAPSASRRIEVRRGDTLWALAARHLGDPLLWSRLHDANRGVVANPDVIFPGQQLRIPGAAAEPQGGNGDAGTAAHAVASPSEHGAAAQE